MGYTAAMRYDIDVVSLTEQRVASIVIPGIDRSGVTAALGGALPEVYTHLFANGLAMVGAPFARYHPAAGDTIDLEAGIPVVGAFPETEDIRARTLPGGEAAHTVHVGSYEALPEALEAVGAWLTAQGRTAAGPFWEVYVDDPTTVAPDALRTEVFLPLA